MLTPPTGSNRNATDSSRVVEVLDDGVSERDDGFRFDEQLAELIDAERLWDSWRSQQAFRAW